MKKFNKILIIILLMSITIIGCKPTKPIKDDSGVIEHDGTLEGKKTMTRFLELIQPENKASDLGLYIKENIEYVNEIDAEEMMNWLLIYQTEITNNFNYKLSYPEYLEALDVNMNGILDETEIHNIEDEKIREDYQGLVDGFMTIRRYEETPVVETDWKRLNELSSYVSEDLGTIFEIYPKNQNYEYNKEDLDVENIVLDLLKIEPILENHEADFVYSLGNELYKIQLYSLLTGPEGYYLDFFICKDSKEYKDIIKLKDDYLDSDYGKIIADLDREDYEDPMDISDKIDKHLKFGVKSNNYFTWKELEEDDIKYNLFEIKIPEDEEKQNKINKMIEKDIEEYIDGIVEDKDFIITVYPVYEDNQYISYNGFLSYYDESKTNLSFYRNLDYINEKYITLEEYLETDLNNLKEHLKKIKEVKIESIPDFQITNNGIDIYLQDKPGMDGYIQLSKKDLIEYLSLDKLTKKY